MTKPIIMLIDDAPIPEVQMAKAMEHHVRTSEFGRLCNEGHVKVIQDDDPLNIRCQIEEEVFSCPRDVFPTIELMARLQLAIAAGQSCNNLRNDIYAHIADASNYSSLYGSARGGGKSFAPAKWLTRAELKGYDALDDYARSDAVAAGYANVSKITATVKRDKKKGLRP